MELKLKTLEQIKYEACYFKEVGDGIECYYDYSSKRFYHINTAMFIYFGKDISVKPYFPKNEDDKEWDDKEWDYEDIAGWVYLKRWFESNLFTDEDFLI